MNIRDARDELVHRYFSEPSRSVQVPGLSSGPGIAAGSETLALRLGDAMPYAPLKRMQGLVQKRHRDKHESVVHGIGIGVKNGTDTPAVVVYVTKKLPKHRVRSEHLVPEAVDDVRTDVVESPMPRLADCTDTRRDRNRPLVGGISVGRNDGPSGTLGAFVYSTRAGDPPSDVLLLSNSHVFYSGSGRPEGVPVVQPSTDDGRGEVVGIVRRATTLQVTKPVLADAAIASVSVPVDNRICGIGRVTAPIPPAKDMVVVKHGRTSGRTAGTIVATGLAQLVTDDSGRSLTFMNFFRVEPGADGPPVGALGDSGALVVQDGSRAAVGLLVAAEVGGTFYLAQPIGDICAELEIALKLD